MENKKNLMLPGNPRYQPQSLVAHFGYDNLYRYVAEVEIANLDALAEIGVIPREDAELLTTEVRLKLAAITATEVERVEKITRHDIRAWVRLAQEVLPEPLRRWLHVPLTSYDALDTARSLQFMRAHEETVAPLTHETIILLADMTEEFAGTPQIGRTHGQHALPITVGFWLATILNRIVSNARRCDAACSGLVGKISGAVGAYNAQVALGIADRCGTETYEEIVLEKLGLKAAAISTQILPPEPLAEYLFACTLQTAALAQFGRDCRNLMRSEIGEVAEEFAAGQVGSSTMAHKRNPITFENIEGMWLRTRNEFGKVLDTLVSEHQRDLVGSCVSRDFPAIVVNLVQQLSALTRADNNGLPFIARIAVDAEKCKANFNLNANLVMAEAVYIALQMAGYQGDAHEIVNRRAIRIAKENSLPVMEAVGTLANRDESLREAIRGIPLEVRTLLGCPEKYLGNASDKAMEIVDLANEYLRK